MGKRKTKPPQELAGTAAEAWKQFAEQLGEVDPEDQAALIVLSLAWAEMGEAQHHIEANGTIIKLPNGYPGPNPYCKVRKEARTVVLKLLNEFGLTPLGRSKIEGTKPEENKPVALPPY